MAGLIVQGNYPRRWLPAVKSWYGTYDDLPVEYTQYLKVITSDSKYEDFVSMAGMGYAKVKQEGQSRSYDDTKQGLATRFEPVVYTTGFVISDESIQDDKYAPSILQFSTKQAAFSMRQSKEIVAATLLSNAATTTFLSDGQPLLSTSHALAKSGGTFSNTLSIPSDLSEASLEALMVQMMTIPNDAGLIISCTAKKLIVTPNDMFNAYRITKSPLQVNTANNNSNAIKDMGMLSDGIGIARFSSLNSGWFIMSNIQDQGNGMILVQRNSVKMKAQDQFDTNSVKYAFDERYVVGCADFRAIHGSVGA